MESDTGWRRASPALLPSGLGRRLLLSYLAIFTLLLAGFAVVVHITFSAVFAREEHDRLRAMLTAAESAVDAGPTGISVDLADETIRSIDARIGGLRWSDVSGRVIAAYGLGKSAPVPGAFRAATQFNTGDRNTRKVLIEAAISPEPYVRNMRSIDLGILLALLFAVAGSVVAGRWLTNRLVRELDSNMRTLQDFSADAAHELRGPLTALATNSASATSFSEDALLISRRAMDSISSATAQMISVSEDLLTLARANQPIDRELFIVDLDEAARNVIALYGDEARRRRVSLRSAGLEPARAYGNPDQIEQIVGNLVHNGLRYTPPGGEVRVACVRERSGSRVVVTDNGIGIAPEHFKRIFERFWRADPSRSEPGASGLGLTIARELARRHAGDITVSSRPGEGSEFVLTLPAKPPRRFRLL
jgi:two-component system, OmpR family, manganese sensing sensor histidine kinase